MKIPPSLALIAVLALPVLSGCAHLQMAAVEGDTRRVVSGTIHVPDGMLLPPDAKALVRVVDVSNSGLESSLGDQEIPNPGVPPIPFHVEFRATDEQLRRGLNLEARISVGGTLRYYNRNQFSVNLDNLERDHPVEVNEVSR